MTLNDACKMSMAEMPGMKMDCILEVPSGLVFSFVDSQTKESADISPVLVSKTSGDVSEFFHRNTWKS